MKLSVLEQSTPAEAASASGHAAPQTSRRTARLKLDEVMINPVAAADLDISGDAL